MSATYPPLDRVVRCLRQAADAPAIIGAARSLSGTVWAAGVARPPFDLTIIGYEEGFPILSWQWSPDDRFSAAACYGVRYRQLAPGPSGIVVPRPVWVSSPGPAHRTIWDVYGCCIFGGTYEVSVNFVPPDWPASESSQPVRVVLPEAF
jgi:hypothetical protein